MERVHPGAGSALEGDQGEEEPSQPWSPRGPGPSLPQGLPAKPGRWPAMAPSAPRQAQASIFPSLGFLWALLVR